MNIEDIQAVAAAYSLTALTLQPLPDAGTLAASPNDFVASATWTVYTVADDPDAVPAMASALPRRASARSARPFKAPTFTLEMT